MTYLCHTRYDIPPLNHGPATVVIFAPKTVEGKLQDIEFPGPSPAGAMKHQGDHGEAAADGRRIFPNTLQVLHGTNVVALGLTTDKKAPSQASRFLAQARTLNEGHS